MTMGTRYRATKLRTTFQASLGTKVPEKRVQLAFLADRIEIKGLPCPPIAGVEGHPIYKQAKAYPYEDISAYFRMVDEEVRQRGERAKPAGRWVNDGIADNATPPTFVFRKSVTPEEFVAVLEGRVTKPIRRRVSPRSSWGKVLLIESPDAIHVGDVFRFESVTCPGYPRSGGGEVAATQITARGPNEYLVSFDCPVGGAGPGYFNDVAVDDSLVRPSEWRALEREQECAERRMLVGKAFAELGRIVGEHAGDIRLSAEYPDPEESLRKLAAACSYRFATITETAPVKADRMSPFTEGAAKWARGLRAIEAIGFDDRWDAEAKKKLGGG